MRRLSFSLLILWLLSLVTLPAPVKSQEEVRIFNPPVTPIELGAREPLPPGVSAELEFGGWGGGGDNPVEREWRWEKVPPILGHPVTEKLTACGPYSVTVPDYELTLADGTKPNILPSVRVVPVGVRASLTGRCWQFEVEWKRGMVLGLYTLTLKPSTGRGIAHTWGVDYPFCAMPPWGQRFWSPRGIIPSKGKERTENFVGYNANQNLVLDFYYTEDYSQTRITRAEYLATRTIKTDENGSAWLDIRLTRSAPTREVNAIGYQVRGEEVNEFGFSTFGRDIRYSPTCLGTYPSAAEIRERNENSSVRMLQVVVKHRTQKGITLYSRVGDLSSKRDELTNGTVVSILEQKPMLTEGRVFGWYRLRSQTGKQGWAYGQIFEVVEIQLPTPTPAPQLCRGSLPPRLTVGKIAQVTPGDANRLRSSPTGGVIGTIPGGTLVMVIGGPKCGANNFTFWQVEFDGKRGWTAESNTSEYWLVPTRIG